MNICTGSLFVLALASLSLVACVQDEIDAPPINGLIVSEVGQHTVSSTVECEGPAEQIALLASLCGSSSAGMSWSNTNALGSGMATIVGKRGEAQLIITNEIERTPSHQENVAAEVSHAAFVVLETDELPESFGAALNQWTEGEAVTSGVVVVEMVQFVACTQSWVASANFVWRDVTISLSWQAARPC